MNPEQEKEAVTMMLEEGMRVPVCIRDGEETATISVGGVCFVMGAGDLIHLIVLADESLLNAAGAVQRSLKDALPIIVQAARMVTVLSSGCTDTESECNRTRWGATGLGGVKDLETISTALDRLERAIAEDFYGERERFASRGRRLVS